MLDLKGVGGDFHAVNRWFMCFDVSFPLAVSKLDKDVTYLNWLQKLDEVLFVVYCWENRPDNSSGFFCFVFAGSTDQHPQPDLLL